MTANGYTGNTPGGGGGGGAVDSVNGRTGAVTLTKTDVGLSAVDNTADSAKTFTEAQVTNLTTDLAAKAPLASPTLTGTPAAPTATAGTSTTQLATTAFVTTADNLKAPLASPALTGTPTAPTATALDNSTKLATTAYADAADAVNFPMLKWNGSAYVVATGAKVYVGAGTPSSPADGSVWLTS